MKTSIECKYCHGTGAVDAPLVTLADLEDEEDGSQEEDLTQHSETDKKTERLHMLISPAEIEAIETWRFANRIQTRAEAVRRLVKIGLSVPNLPDTKDS